MLNTDTGCTLPLCPKEVAIRNGVTVEEADPDEPPCKDAQGNIMEIFGQAHLELEISAGLNRYMEYNIKVSPSQLQ